MMTEMEMKTIQNKSITKSMKNKSEIKTITNEITSMTY